MKALAIVQHAVLECMRCPRLVDYRAQSRATNGANTASGTIGVNRYRASGTPQLDS